MAFPVAAYTSSDVRSWGHRCGDSFCPRGAVKQSPPLLAHSVSDMSPIDVLALFSAVSAITWLAATCTWRGALARKAAAAFIGNLVLLAAVLSPLMALAAIAGLIGVFVLVEAMADYRSSEPTASKLPTPRTLGAKRSSTQAAAIT